MWHSSLVSTHIELVIAFWGIRGLAYDEFDKLQGSPRHKSRFCWNYFCSFCKIRCPISTKFYRVLWDHKSIDLLSLSLQYSRLAYKFSDSDSSSIRSLWRVIRLGGCLAFFVTHICLHMTTHIAELSWENMTQFCQFSNKYVYHQAFSEACK